MVEPLTSMGAGWLFAGVELGGTKCICTLAHGPESVLEQHAVPTTVPQETLPAILSILQDWDAKYGFSALGLASFGPLGLQPAFGSYGHILATAKPGWPNADVLGVLATPFAVPTGLDTDVNGAALAEMLWGCGQGLDDFAYVTVGTGVGVGLFVNGAPTRGMGHSEIGHIRVPRLPGDTLESVCPYHGDCVEGLASGTAVKARLAGRAVAGLEPDDPIWTPIVHTLAAMCHALVCTSGPQRIAIGGGVLTGQPHLHRRINEALLDSLAGYMPLPDDGDYIVPPLLGARAGPLGSIALAAGALRRSTITA